MVLDPFDAAQDARGPSHVNGRRRVRGLGSLAISASVGVDEHPTFRPDIEGLRAVAVIAVVLYHCGFAPHSGFVGVDVFFVISGFLITGLLLRDAGGSGGRISLTRFYARRARRIVPAATFAIVVTVAGCVLFPQLRWLQDTVASDGRAASLFFANLKFADLNHGYFAPRPSMFRQFWSLAVEEQFYVVWPLVVLVGLGFRNRRGRLFALLTVGSAASLFLCVRYTPGYQSYAFYLLPTRAWELAAGGLLALGASRVASVPAAGRQVAAAAGVVVVGVAAFVIPFESFPGLGATLPVIGTLLIIGGGVGVVARVLSLPPLRVVGRYSYSLYLLHWAVLAVAASHDADGVVSPGQALLLVVVIAAPLAVVSYHFVEAPIRFGTRFASPMRGLAVAVAGVSIGVLASSALPAVASRAEATAETAMPLPAGSVSSTAFVPSNLTPSLTRAVQHRYAQNPWDWNEPWECHEMFCAFGASSPTKTIALFGDSHAVHWLGAFYEAARANGWRVVDVTKAGCPSWSSAREDSSSGCPPFRQVAMRRIATLRPDLVVISNAARRELPSGAATLRAEATANVEALQRIAPVLVFGETPSAAGNVPECLSRHLRATEKCEPSPREPVRSQVNALLGGVANRSGARFVDPTPWLCWSTRCPVVVGNLLAYFDDDHMTPAFSRSRGPLVAAALREVLSTSD